MPEYKVLIGDCREQLKKLDDESINCCVTSPPYYNLRDYGTGTWVGGNPECDHIERHSVHGGDRADRDQSSQVFQYTDTCGKCGAAREDYQIGAEQTPEEFIDALVSVFREVKRVLRDDGTLWVNIGDSYYNYRPGRGQAQIKQTISSNTGAVVEDSPRRNNKLHGLKEKDLIGIPWRLALALQADGWYLRQDIIWQKENPMPESVKDRCTKAHEYIFLLSKSPKYYYDHVAMQEPVVTNTRKANGELYESRNRRSVWTVNTKPFKGAHFAVYPPELIEPCILAGCPNGGTVLDPFGGSGTTAGVAMKNGRNAVLCELNPDYVDIMDKRITSIAGPQTFTTLFDINGNDETNRI